MCQHRLRFYAQARTEVADRASQERTLTDILVGTTVGTIGNEMGAVGANQETSKKRQECIETHQKECVLRVSDGVERATNSINKWTILDSNQRPPRCQCSHPTIDVSCKVPPCNNLQNRGRFHSVHKIHNCALVITSFRAQSCTIFATLTAHSGGRFPLDTWLNKHRFVFSRTIASATIAGTLIQA